MECKTKNETSVYVSFCDDCEDNVGGYYCEIYYDEDMQYEYDNFVIHNWELSSNGNLDEAEQLAKEYVATLSLVDREDVYYAIEERLRKIFESRDAMHIAENIIDDVVDDIAECADDDYNDSDINIALCRVMMKKMGLEY